MITISRDGSRVAIAIEAHIPRLGMRVFTSWIECGNEVSAGLLATRLQDELSDTVRAARAAEYVAGWKDARSHKKQKREWFTWKLNREASR